MLENLAIIFGVFLIMEGVTWCTHKYVMHGFLWILHEDHHDHRLHESWWEKNDAFFIIFAVPSMILILLGTVFSVPYCWQIGAGITLYGLAYFLVHDVFIHQRLKIFRNSESAYFRGLRRAHKMHHKHLGKEEGECFGMLFVPFKYFRRELEAKRS
ncbi:MAG: beta-carotene hydroxylase [Flavobacteriales bacterium]|nr:beta-carotene hydroxylase [Flavobacteriales bacterium]